MERGVKRGLELLLQGFDWKRGSTQTIWAALRAVFPKDMHMARKAYWILANNLKDKKNLQTMNAWEDDPKRTKKDIEDLVKRALGWELV